MEFEIVSINGFELPSKNEYHKLKVEQYVGFLSRKSHVFISYKCFNKFDRNVLINYKEANNKFMSWIAHVFGENNTEYNQLKMNYQIVILKN